MTSIKDQLNQKQGLYNNFLFTELTTNECEAITGGSNTDIKVWNEETLRWDTILVTNDEDDIYYVKNEKTGKFDRFYSDSQK